MMRSEQGNENILDDSDMAKGVDQPPMEKPRSESGPTIALSTVTESMDPRANLFKCMVNRESRRSYTGEPLSLDEMAFLLWCTQGVKRVIPGYRRFTKDGKQQMRVVPSGGARNVYETYLAVLRVEGLESGIWRYRPIEHELTHVATKPGLGNVLAELCSNPGQQQHYVTSASVLFMWTCVPYRGEWRYKHSAHKNMLIDLGHICQNLYLGVEAIGCGCCAIGGYRQSEADALLGVDGEDEFTTLCAAVGRLNAK